MYGNTTHARGLSRGAPPASQILVQSRTDAKLGRDRHSVPGFPGRGFAGSLLPHTIPFALYCASLHLDDFGEALWATVGGLGDRDTTCAIVGGVVALATGIEGIPPAWRQAREPLPTIV